MAKLTKEIEELKQKKTKLQEHYSEEIKKLQQKLNDKAPLSFSLLPDAAQVVINNKVSIEKEADDITTKYISQVAELTNQLQ